MKKYVLYSVLLLVGLALGYVFFGSSSQQTPQHTHEQTEQWTCSMHPQIMSPTPGKCPICGMELIPATKQTEGLPKNAFELTKNAMALANITTMTVGVSNAQQGTLSLSGIIATNEENTRTQTSYYQGRIEALHVKSTGEYVKKGQLLATIYAPELLTAQQELLTAFEIKDEQPQLYKAVRNKFTLWKFTETQIDALIKEAKPNAMLPIYATVSGTVTDKLISEGATVQRGQALFNIADLSSVWVLLDLYEKDLSSVQVGSTIDITTQEFPEEPVRAKVSFIDPELTLSSRTAKVRVVLDNNKGSLKPGMFASGKVQIANNAKDVLSIPASAVLWTGKQSVVYVKTHPSKPVFEMRIVRLGKRIEDQYEVLSGLDSGEEVVVNGTFTVDAAAQLQGKKSMMSHSSGSATSKKLEADTAFKNDLKNAFSAYLALKDALTHDNSTEAQSHAKILVKSMGSISTKGLTKTSLTQWNVLSNPLQKAAQELSDATDIKKQRAVFIGLSSQWISILETISLEQEVYQQYCPMANNNKGASWLSLEKKIVNPYYGSAMLSCGEITKTIQ